ncbi:class I SAM-dependent methyltransferase [Flexivirga sp. ID2601S]|uniref:Class I SAM-dependent methyltransferase n=1 Tax=Flexivirga aerilata TaxID=1656889 RepID=A0A849AJ55_9MICO|nr:class I SAM-dependent methyltransferase [Flexivirga aerilata]NNG39867.1 class I SAM-dependent methyltransferase [Flexivirga aerilata]
MTTHAHDEPLSPAEHRAYWEDRYSGERMWSGKPNGPLVAALTKRPAAGETALDLGCGTGGDAIWLAQQGLRVTGVDIADAALRQAAEAASSAGVADRIEWARADLDDWEPGRTWDLVLASFLHSPAVSDRDPLLERVMEWVAPGGELIVLSHLRAPEWRDQHDMHLPSLREIEAFLDRPGWAVESAEETITDLPSPEGEPGTRVDTLVRVRRAAG